MVKLNRERRNTDYKVFNIKPYSGERYCEYQSSAGLVLDSVGFQYWFDFNTVVVSEPVGKKVLTVILMTSLCW